ncbi:MAG TPA: hypothetical protein VMH80_03365 [Bryobacteraceae bacterium]|nr:hypothetical protein [Bryobacteraceae bacterium]
MTTVTAVRSEGFIQSIGVNTHLSWTGTTYANIQNNENDIAYLGISHVRDAAPVAGFTLSDYQALASQGVKFDIIATSPTVNVQSDLSQIDQLVNSNPGSVVSIEGPNELNAQDAYYNGVDTTDSPSTTNQIMQALDSGVHGDSTLAGVSVLNASISIGPSNWLSYVQQEGNMSGYVDAGNWHVYFNNGLPPAAGISQAVANAQIAAPGKPVFLTESGYYTAPQSTDWGGVNQDVQAKETLNLLLDAYKDGVQTTYLYELLDGVNNPASTDREDSFGLFNGDGTPKEAATAIHNLTAILKDSGGAASSFTPGSLNYSISNLPSTANSMLMEKSDGTFDLTVWDEQTIWNEASQSEISVGTQNATVNLGATYNTVKVFDPLAGTTAIQTLSNVSQVQLGLTDHPLIIEVEPGAATTGGSTTGTTTTGGSATGTTTATGGSSGSGSTGSGTGTTKPTPSPAGTQLTSTSGSLIDQNGNTWTLVQSSNGQGLQIASNGVVDASTSQVTLLESLNGSIVQENSSSNWYSEPGPSGPWAQISAPTTSNSGSTTGTTTAGGSGQVTVSGGSGTQVFNAGSGNETLIGGTGNNVFNLNSGLTVVTLAGNSTVNGGTGAATFNMAGNDTITAGSGAETYVFTKGTVANAVISDFQTGTDHIHLSGFSARAVRAAESQATVSGGNTQLQLSDGTKIEMVGVSHLSSAMFA